jgi:hypothetical protein
MRGDVLSNALNRRLDLAFAPRGSTHVEFSLAYFGTPSSAQRVTYSIA